MHTGIRSKIESTSSFVTASWVRPFRRAANRRPTRSSHPQRRSRPVTVPYSAPCSRIAAAALLVGLAGERACSDPGQVGLGHAQHRVDPGRPQAQTGTGAAGDRVAAGDERIGAVVEVEQRALGALAQQHLAVVEGAVDEQRRVGDVRPHPRRVVQRRLGQHVLVERPLVVDLAQQDVLHRQRRLDLRPQDLLVQQVLDADADARRLVRVRRPDPTPGGADLQAVRASARSPSR